MPRSNGSHLSVWDGVLRAGKTGHQSRQALQQSGAGRAAEAVGATAVDLVIAAVGGRTIQDSVARLGYRGRDVRFGVAGRDMTPFNPLALWDKNAALHELGLMNSLQHEYASVYAMITDCMQRVSKGEFNVAVDQVFSPADAAKAHAATESRCIFGRVVMKV